MCIFYTIKAEYLIAIMARNILYFLALSYFYDSLATWMCTPFSLIFLRIDVMLHSESLVF